jgi:anti-anti-sigma regulatory factor
MSDFSVHTEMEEDNALATMKVSGAITLSSVGEFLMQLSTTFDLADNVVIDLSGVTEIDVAGLQLLCSSHRSSLLSSKGLRIVGQDSPAIREPAAASGQVRTSGCEIDTKHTCIWIGGEN